MTKSELQKYESAAFDAVAFDDAPAFYAVPAFYAAFAAAWVARDDRDAHDAAFHTARDAFAAAKNRKKKEVDFQIAKILEVLR